MNALRMKNAILEQMLLTLDVNVEALAICEVQRGTRLIFIPANAIEVHYVLVGTMHLTTSGETTLICGPGSVIIVPQGTSQSVAADGNPTQDAIAENHCCTARDGLALYDGANGSTGDLRLVCGIISANNPAPFGLLNHLTRPIAQNLSDVQVIRQAFAAMLDEITAFRPGARAVLGALMKICLVNFLRTYIEATGIQSAQFAYLRAPRLHKAVAAVLDKPAAELSVAALASIAGMSRSAFAREFLETFAITPMEFVKTIRLRQAAELLRATDVPVKTIASIVGFASRSHFSSSFRDAYGADPRTFRRRSFASDPLQNLVNAPMYNGGS